MKTRPSIEMTSTLSFITVWGVEYIKESKPEYGPEALIFSELQGTYKKICKSNVRPFVNLFFRFIDYLIIHLSKSSCASIKLPVDCRVRASPSAAIIVSKEFHPWLTKLLLG